MKYTVAALALAAVVAAQTLADIPACALPCINEARESSTNCAETDYKCICDNINTLTTAATPCVISSCGADVAINQVLPATQRFCAAVNAGTGPTSGSTSAAPTSAEPTSEPTAQPTSGSAGQSTAEPTGEPTGEPTSGGATASTEQPSVYPTASSSSAVSNPGTTQAPGGAGGNGTVVVPPTSVIPTAGAAVAGSIGGFAMLALGALAVL
ncbi:hypothetical protein F4802DRAFT_293732 [Xylaria palmicola]|nr:hypothetical protein F4802DRAFT_293732 [Xylaria palmicola]